MGTFWQKAGICLLTLENRTLETAILTADASGAAGAPPSGSGYVAFDMGFLKAAAAVICSSVGSIFNAAIWAFLIVLGVFTAIDFIRKHAR